MKSLSKYICEAKVSIEELLEQIVNSASEKPAIYDDTESYDASGDFDYWQYDDGTYDDTFEVVKKEINDKAIAGWFTEKSFEETEKILPTQMKSFIGKKGKQLYKKNNDEVIMWEGKISGYDYKILKFRQWRGNERTYSTEFWYVITLE